jgi:hypothetical protein
VQALFASCGRVVQLAGSVIEKPQGHSKASRFSPNARLISCWKIIGRPHTGQMVSISELESSVIPYLSHRCHGPALTTIKGTVSSD